MAGKFFWPKSSDVLVRCTREDIQAAQDQWRHFLAEAPPFPATMFRGRGIVILAGGLTYMVPAWANIHMLRRTGMRSAPSCFNFSD